MFNINCEFLSSIDLFGKEPELYFRNKPIKTSGIGLIFTLVYILLYIAFFIYKFLRMLSRVDVTFYDTYAYHDIPSIHLTPENFYGGFSIGYHIDETIYYPKAYFYSGKKEEAGWNWKYQVIELEPCKLEKFGSNYQELFKDKPLETLYCLKDVNFTLEGYANLNVYSYIYVEFYPCKGTTQDGRVCRSQEYIEGFFAENIIEFKMEDMELSPEIYKTPMKPTEKDINSPVYRDLHQHIYSYLQIIFLETDEDLIGFGTSSKTKLEQFIKYDESWLIAAPPKGGMFETNEPICDVSLQLSAKVLTQRRTYVKLIEVLGDVGGLMEFIWSLFSVVTTLIGDILYEKALINDLFSYDLKDKKVMIREKNRLTSDIPTIYNKENNTERSKGIYLKGSTLEKTVNEKKKEEDEKDKEITPKEKDKDKEIVIAKRGRVRKRYRLNLKTNNSYGERSEQKKIVQKNNQLQSVNHDFHKMRIDDYEFSRANHVNNQINVDNSKEKEKEKEKEIDKDIYNNENDNDIDNDDYYNELDNSTINKTNESNKRHIDHIRLNYCCIYFCFLFVRRRKNLENILLNEGSRIIRRNLDIINIFKTMFKEEENKANISFKRREMSDECKQQLISLKLHKK